MRKLAALGVALLVCLLPAGCGDDATTSAPDRSSSAATAPAPAASPGLREQAPKGDNGSGADTMSARLEVVTGSVDITADAPVAAAAVIAERVRAVGGRVDSRTEQPGGGDTEPSAALTVRVPADRTDAFLDGLAEVGRVTEITVSRDDVTMRWEDLDARIKALQASVDRLRALIAGATSTADLIAAEQALSSRQGELDSLTAQKRHLDDQVALSTLTIDITADGAEPDDGPGGFWGGIVSGWRSLVNWLADAVVFTGTAIPWLGFFVVAAALLWAVARGALRLRKRRAGSAESTSAPAGAARSAGTGREEDGTGGTGADGGQGDDQAEQP